MGPTISLSLACNTPLAAREAAPPAVPSRTHTQYPNRVTCAWNYPVASRAWCPTPCLQAHDGDEIVGVIVCKAEVHKRSELMRGYIAMLAVDARYRKRGIGTMLVALAINKMKETCGEVVLETELANTAALKLYAKLGFVRDKLMRRYYLNGGDAYRLKVWFQ